MCTVTYIPVREKVFLTSNRDEKSWRSSAIPPQGYEFNSGHIFFPKDGDAGGTWFAVHENSNAIVLLNGGFRKHEPQPPYRKSRGLILVDLIQKANPYDHFRSINLENIEPFTLVVWQDDELFECRWDGERKHAKPLDKTLSYIWSSATLYDDDTVAKRNAWFEKWRSENPEPSQEDIFHFHEFTGDGDSHNDLRMNRDGQVFTVSITGVAISENRASIRYADLRENGLHLQEVLLQKASVN